MNTIREQFAKEQANLWLKTNVAMAMLLVIIFLLGLLMGASCEPRLALTVAIFLVTWSTYHQIIKARTSRLWISTVVFLILTSIEFYAIGMPEQLIEPGPAHSRGMIFDMMIALIPFLYVGLRLLMTLPFIYALVVYRNR